MILFTSSLCGCAFLAKKDERTVIGALGSAEGQWRGKALVKNLRTGKSGTLALEIVAREPSQLRMEITGSFGVHLASVVLNGNEVRSVLTQEKKFISAPADEDALSRLIPVRIPPRALMALLFDRPFPSQEWKCEYKATGEPKICSHREESVIVKWEDQQGGTRRLKIGSAEADVSMVLEESRSKVELTPEIFHLESPRGYRHETISGT